MIDIHSEEATWIPLGEYLTVADQLQFLSMHGESGEVELSNGKCLGTLYLRHGEVIQALCARRQIMGHDASLCLICMTNGHFRFRRTDAACARTINEPTAALLLNAARWSDEGRRLCAIDRPERGTDPAEWLLLMHFGSEYVMVPLERSRMLIGRGSGCEVVILVRSVSRKHAEIEISDDRVVLRDLNSKNGTLVNGRYVREAILRRHDDLQFADVSARLIHKTDASNYRKTKQVRQTSIIGQADMMHVGGDYPTIRKMTRVAA